LARSYPVAVDNSPPMSTPAMNFVAVCGNANLPVNGSKVTYLKALKESGVSVGPSQNLPDIKERFAALTWVRHAVANAVDPATWPSTLSAPLIAVLRTLYPIPPQRPDAPVGETDLHRLANMVALFLPAALSATPRPLRSPCRATPVAASTLRDQRPRRPLRRLLPRRQPPLPRLPRPSSISRVPARSDG
jgi:hypothetical protein